MAPLSQIVSQWRCVRRMAALLPLLWVVSRETAATDYHIAQPRITAAEGSSVGGGFSVAGGLRPDASEAMSNTGFRLTGSFSSLTFNHAPAAMPDAVTRPAGDDIKIDLRQLLSNDLDPEADSLSVQVSPASAAGVPILVSGRWIYYLHASESPDYFTYTVRDQHGAISHGRVDILIAEQDSQTSTLLRIAVDGSGAHIHFNGIPNRAYVIQSREAIEDPWVDLAFAGDLGQGRFRFDDAVGGVTRFYRVLYRP